MENHLIDKIGTKLDKIPQKNSTFFDVFEGGLSVTIKFHKRFGSVVINDTNKELINTYNVIKKEPQKLIEMLRTHEANHSHDYYYFIRDQDKKKENKEDDLIDKAARMIYLNKTCYNGLYRVNSKGHFNVPIGRQNKIKLF